MTIRNLVTSIDKHLRFTSIDWRILGNSRSTELHYITSYFIIPSSFWVQSTGIVYTNLLTCLHRKKSRYAKSDNIRRSLVP